MNYGIVSVRRQSRNTTSKKRVVKTKQKLKTNKRKPTKVAFNQLDIVEDQTDDILMNILDLNKKSKRQLKKAYHEVDRKIFYLHKQNKMNQKNVEKVIDEAYMDIYRTDNKKLGKLIKQRSKVDPKYQKQVSGKSDEQVGRQARKQIDAKLKANRKYAFDFITTDKSGKPSKWVKGYDKLWHVGSKDTERNLDTKKKGTFDLWSIRHFIGGFFIGLIIPNESVKMFGAGVAFEVGEEVLAEYTPAGTSEPLSNKASDLVMNQLGYELGSGMRNIVAK